MPRLAPVTRATAPSILCAFIVSSFLVGLLGAKTTLPARIHRRRGRPGTWRASSALRARGRPADGAHLAARGAAAEEQVLTVGLEPADGDARGHLQALEDFAVLRIDAPDLALFALHRAVPELAVDPGNAGDETIRLDRLEDGAGLG